MVGELPASVSFGTVNGRFVFADADGADGGTDPDGTAATGTVTFTPSVTHLKVAGATPPTTVIPRAIVCTLDSDGLLNDPQGNDFVKLIATDDADLDPVGWTWNVAIAITGEAARSFDIAVPAGDTIDLTTLATVASSEGNSTLAHSERQNEFEQSVLLASPTPVLWPDSVVAERGGLTHASLTGIWTVGVAGTYQVIASLGADGVGQLQIRKDAAAVSVIPAPSGEATTVVATFDAAAGTEIDVFFQPGAGDVLLSVGYASVHRLP